MGGEAADGKKMLALVDALRPDIVLSVLRLPAAKSIGRLRERGPELGVLALTMYADDA